MIGSDRVAAHHDPDLLTPGRGLGETVTAICRLLPSPRWRVGAAEASAARMHDQTIVCIPQNPPAGFATGSVGLAVRHAIQPGMQATNGRRIEIRLGRRHPRKHIRVRFHGHLRRTKRVSSSPTTVAEVPCC